MRTAGRVDVFSVESEFSVNEWILWSDKRNEFVPIYSIEILFVSTLAACVTVDDHELLHTVRFNNVGALYGNEVNRRMPYIKVRLKSNGWHIDASKWSSC